ncbi:MAG: hypothetical protein HYW86_03175 [Candidatus Roizmanbacteria bacterium]|nr:MAG: hypothetical protein HYW86_03175 [Candidatus Roizmanbacteria bacterium]
MSKWFYAGGIVAILGLAIVVTSVVMVAWNVTDHSTAALVFGFGAIIGISGPGIMTFGLPKRQTTEKGG